ncbi:MAG: FHA domain-containing protein, partial [Deltaproteobacteria bacterium]|nr:FHA domain-containing protein [Deltaproteobacteria bacterium]
MDGSPLRGPRRGHRHTDDGAAGRFRLARRQRQSREREHRRLPQRPQRRSPRRLDAHARRNRHHHRHLRHDDWQARRRRHRDERHGVRIHGLRPRRPHVFRVVRPRQHADPRGRTRHRTRPSTARLRRRDGSHDVRLGAPWRHRQAHAGRRRRGWPVHAVPGRQPGARRVLRGRPTDIDGAVRAGALWSPRCSAGSRTHRTGGRPGRAPPSSLVRPHRRRVAGSRGRRVAAPSPPLHGVGAADRRADEGRGRRRRRETRRPEDRSRSLKCVGRLVIYRDSERLAEHDLARGVLGLGRHPENDIVLDDRTLSRFHAKIVRQGLGDSARWMVVDLGAQNGVHLNGERIAAEVELHPGDRIELGRYTAVFEAPAPARPKSAAARPTAAPAPLPGAGIKATAPPAVGKPPSAKPALAAPPVKAPARPSAADELDLDEDLRMDDELAVEVDAEFKID